MKFRLNIILGARTTAAIIYTVGDIFTVYLQGFYIHCNVLNVML